MKKDLLTKMSYLLKPEKRSSLSELLENFNQKGFTYVRVWNICDVSNEKEG